PEAERGRKTAPTPRGGERVKGPRSSPSAPPLRFGEGAGGGVRLRRGYSAGRRSLPGATILYCSLSVAPCPWPLSGRAWSSTTGDGHRSTDSIMSEPTPHPPSTDRPSGMTDPTLGTDASSRPTPQQSGGVTEPPGDTGPSAMTQSLGDPAAPSSGDSSAGLPVVPGYEVLAELGRGGMGVVYKAQQISLNRPVALKMLRDSALAGPEQMTRLRTEAAAAARLQHPHIVQIYDLYQHNGLPFYAMEYVPG